MRRFAALRRHGFHVQRRPARDPRQWLSGHSSPSTDNARSCDRSLLRRRWALPAAFSPAPPAAFYRKYRDRWPRSAGAGAGFSPPQSAGWWSYGIGHLNDRLRRLGMDQHGGFGMQSFIRINAWVLNSSCTMHAPCQHSTSAPV